MNINFKLNTRKRFSNQTNLNKNKILENIANNIFQENDKHESVESKLESLKEEIENHCMKKIEQYHEQITKKIDAQNKMITSFLSGGSNEKNLYNKLIRTLGQHIINNAFEKNNISTHQLTTNILSNLSHATRNL